MFNNNYFVCRQLRAQGWMEGDDFNTQAVMNICGECAFCKNMVSVVKSSTYFLCFHCVFFLCVNRKAAVIYKTIKRVFRWPDGRPTDGHLVYNDWIHIPQLHWTHLQLYQHGWHGLHPQEEGQQHRLPVRKPTKRRIFVAHLCTSKRKNLLLKSTTCTLILNQSHFVFPLKSKEGKWLHATN